MPTFETDATPDPQAGRTDLAVVEFRPKRRDWKGDLDETFDPAPIPPEVKKAIDQRISTMMRQTRGPDETMFALRKWFSTAARIVRSLPALVRALFSRRAEEPEGAESEEAESPARAAQEDSREEPEKAPSRPQNSQNSQGSQRSRGRRGGRRHHRGGGDRDRREGN